MDKRAAVEKKIQFSESVNCYFERRHDTDVLSKPVINSSVRLISASTCIGDHRSDSRHNHNHIITITIGTCIAHDDMEFLER